MLNPPLEEKTALQQASGAGKSIHTWPGQSAAKLANRFDVLLEQALTAFQAEDPGSTLRKRKTDAKSRFSKRSRDTKPSFPAKPEIVREVVIEAEEVPTVSPEYEDKFNEVIRQTLTKKQIKALTQKSEEEN
jgi:hypothetical protein